jgi:protoporphyrin/coproporphyrin ferrochelatase
MNTPQPPTAILLLNMGGPASLADVGPFLEQLLSDPEIIPLPFQSRLGPFIARRRLKKVQARYAQIGGGSPLLHWTGIQGAELARRLDELCPETAPHRPYIAFRYTPPFTRQALTQMQADGVRRAVALTLYPQFSCATTGASLNELWRSLQAAGLERQFQWSLIDRWPVHPGYIAALAETVRQGMAQVPAGLRAETLLLFSAHSLPLSVVERGDPYPQETGATVQAVMEALDFSHEYLLCYQSAVGPVRWLGPSTESMIRQLGVQKRRSVLVVPAAFVSDHIETLHEMDIEYRELAQKSGIAHFGRAPALNASPPFLEALAELVSHHLRSGRSCSPQYRLRCPGCTNPACRQIANPIR